MRELISAAVWIALLAGTAAAKTERSTYHTFDQVWPTAVRHLRVDERLKIIDKDAETGYVVFELTDGGKAFTGALEVVKTREGDRPVVRLVLTIEDRPDYMEAQILDRLLAKLRHEHGDPPAPPDPPKEKPPADKKKKR